MNKNQKLMKIILFLLNAILIMSVLGVLALIVVVVLQAFNVPINIDYNQMENTFGFIKGEMVMEQKTTMILSTLVLIPVIILTFFIFMLLRNIIADMVNGLHFKYAHVKKIRIMAILIAVQGLLELVMPLLFALILKTHKFTIELFNEKYLWALIVLALAEVFAHGVNLQEDSDMTV